MTGDEFGLEVGTLIEQIANIIYGKDPAAVDAALIELLYMDAYTKEDVKQICLKINAHVGMIMEFIEDDSID